MGRDTAAISERYQVEVSPTGQDKWQAYSVEVEFIGEGRVLLAAARITSEHKGNPVEFRLVRTKREQVLQERP